MGAGRSAEGAAPAGDAEALTTGPTGQQIDFDPPDCGFPRRGRHSFRTRATIGDLSGGWLDGRRIIRGKRVAMRLEPLASVSDPRSMSPEIFQT